MKHRYWIGAALFAATWLVWSGHYTPLLLALGAGCCALVFVLALRTGFFTVEAYTLHLGPNLPRFWGWLLVEIVRSNIAVARLVLRRKLDVRPVIVTVDARHLSPVAQATLANSITLTPGTVTLDVDAGRIEVHCLTQEIADDLRRGEIVARATELAGRDRKSVV